VTGYDFIVDGEGPIITILNPPNESVRGGPIPLEFTVTDELGSVDPNSIVVTVNAEERPFQDIPTAWRVTVDTYTFTFNSVLIQGSKSQASISIAARDSAQNQAREASWLLYLDNIPPIVDLDPPDLQELKDPGVCSVPFDPLGVSSNDLTIQPEGLPKPRVFVWDETNVVVNVTPHHSLVDRDTVYLYLQPDATQPIIEDSDDADSICDRINPSVTINRKLAWVPPDGSAVYSTGTDGSPPGCSYQMSTDMVDRLCTNKTSDLTRVMAFDVDDEEPVIYVNGSLDEPDCTGSGWEIGSYGFDEGWICLAAVAVDNAGNRGVSRPLRLCYDNTATPQHPSCVDLQNPPSCVRDNCTLPKRFTGTVVAID
jgi:hypothetical protein